MTFLSRLGSLSFAVTLSACSGTVSGTVSPTESPTEIRDIAPGVFSGLWQGFGTVVDCAGGPCGSYGRGGTSTPLFFRFEQDGDRVTGIFVLGSGLPQIFPQTYADVAGVVSNGELRVERSAGWPLLSDAVFQALIGGRLAGGFRIDIADNPGSRMPLGGWVRYRLMDVKVSDRTSVGPAANFSGRWAGFYVARTCSETGSAVPSCETWVGRSRFFDITLAQIGNVVTGSERFDSIPLDGTVANDTLTLSGARIYSTAQTVAWERSSFTRDAAGRLTGTLSTRTRSLLSNGAVYSDMHMDRELVGVILVPPTQ